MSFSLYKIVSFILGDADAGVTPSKVCYAMGVHYRELAHEEAQKLIREKRGPNHNVERWTEIANVCDAATNLFKKINI